VCRNAKEGKVTWKVIKESDKDLFEEVRLKESDLLLKIFTANIHEDSASDSSIESSDHDTEANED